MTMNLPDLSLIETVLLRISEESILDFAREHPCETFYAFGFDCNAEYGDVLLCANTEADFAETAKEYIEEWNYGPDDLDSLRHNFGDWKYQGFNQSQAAWDEAWEPYRATIEQSTMSNHS